MKESWQTLGLAASQALAERRFGEAAEKFQRLVELQPDHADSWFNLAYSLRYLRNYAGAAEAYARALEQGVSGPEEGLVNRALIYSEHLNRVDLAEADLLQALSVAPDFVPALINLGMLKEDIGHREAAIDTYRRLVDVSPTNGRARARLAALADQPEAAIRELQTALNQVPMGAMDRAEVEYALGNLLDGVGRYNEAFSVIEGANARMAAQRPAELRYNPLAHEKLVSEIIYQFPVRSKGSLDDGATRLIFICGMFRSGSTVFEQILARHPRIVAGGELEYIPAFVAEYLQPYPRSIGSLDNSTFQKMRSEYVGAISSLHSDAMWVTDKRPDNFLHLGFIKRLFPTAKIFHTRRNPLDILLSTYFLNFAESVSYSEKLEDIAHYLEQYRRLMDHWEMIFGDDIISVDYDDFVRHPDATLIETFRELGLDVRPIDDFCGSDTETAIRTPSAWQAREPLHSRSAGRWRNYKSHLEDFRYLLDE